MVIDGGAERRAEPFTFDFDLHLVDNLVVDNLVDNRLLIVEELGCSSSRAVPQSTLE